MNRHAYIRAERARRSFAGSIRSILNTLPFQVYNDYDWCNFNKRVFTVVGATNIDHLRALQNVLGTDDLDVLPVDTTHFRGLLIRGPGDLSGLFISPRKEYVSTRKDILNQSRDAITLYELQAFGRKHGLKELELLDFCSGVPLCLADNEVLSEMLGIPPEELQFTKYRNSHELYVEKFREHRYDRSTYRLKEIYTEGYDHIEYFSRVYYLEIRTISDIVRRSPISLHDVGTNVAQFPLLLRSLSREDLFDLDISNIIASDNGLSGKQMVNRSLKCKHCSPISFIDLDITDNVSKVPTSDVVMINDVLEHLPCDDSSLHALRNLWDRTGALLIAHVPIEPLPNRVWDHHMIFTPDKIRDWSRQLPGADLISDDYFEEDGLSLTEHGFLMVAR
ncbi:MAG: hypothetical protein JXA22_01490 [Candidatus Thermoplasmatota archaeon]|nr:hypothetical protein [Candidatus Thermoplasmatota archaeon]